MLHRTISEEYVPNQPVESQFFHSNPTCNNGNEFLFPPNFLASHQMLDGTLMPSVHWEHHQNFDLRSAEKKIFVSDDNQMVPSLLPRVAVRHQPDYKTDFLSFGMAAHLPSNFQETENLCLASKVTRSLPIPNMDLSSTRNTAKSLKESCSTWRMQCPECNRRFNSVVNLQNHIASVHKGIRPHRCGVCHKTFGQKATLRTHSRVHTGEKPYKCNTCSRYFADLSTCKKHQRVHDGQKPYECDVCKKRFSQSGNMIRHREGHDKKESRINITTYTSIPARMSLRSL